MWTMKYTIFVPFPPPPFRTFFIVHNVDMSILTQFRAFVNHFVDENHENS